MTATVARRLAQLVGIQHGRVYALVCALMATSLALWALVVVSLPTPDRSLPVPWLAIALGFAVVESFVVNLHFRSESGSFSLLEIPLVFGLLFVEPALLWIAMIVGGLVGLLVFRRQPLLKVAFNVANLSLQVAVAAILFGAFLDGAAPLSPRGWLAMFGATALSAVVQVSMINLVIWITERRFEFRQAWTMTGFGSLVAAANTVQGLIAALIMVVEPWGGVLLACSTGVLFVAYRAYVSERDHRARVEFLHNSTRALRQSGEMRSAVESLLVEATAMFRARTAELVLFSVSDSEEPPTLFTLKNGLTDLMAIDTDGEQWAISVSDAATSPVLVVSNDADTRLLRYLAQRGIGDAMVGALRADHRAIGLFIVGDRLGNVTTFIGEDLRLFQTLVDQAAVALENDQLEQTLSRLRELETKLALQAHYDALTGLANRSLFNSRLEEQIGGDLHGRLEVLYIDLDDFKLVNDRLGHSAGDALLKEVAVRITNIIDPTDLAARLGGDEFALILTAPADSAAIANRIICALSAPFVLGADEVRIGASIGIARHTEDGPPSELLHQADRAMYTAKQRGKGSVVHHSGDLERDQARQQALQTELRRAISEGEFEVVYQPIVRLGDLRIVGAEALVRWRQKSGILLSPADFIDEAERSGLILSIDQLIRTAVLSRVTSFANAAGSPFYCSINLSARHLQQPDLVDRIAADIVHSGADPAQVVLEITESAFVGDLVEAAGVLRKIRDLGIRIALDDFGTGYSALSYLRDLPIDILKIAQPFISDLSRDDNPSFVQAIITLSNTLTVTVIAEGIEDADTLTSLRGMGCELGQGFYFAQPMAGEELENLLRRPAPTDDQHLERRRPLKQGEPSDDDQVLDESLR